MTSRKAPRLPAGGAPGGARRSAEYEAVRAMATALPSGDVAGLIGEFATILAERGAGNQMDFGDLVDAKTAGRLVGRSAETVISWASANPDLGWQTAKRRWWFSRAALLRFVCDPSNSGKSPEIPTSCRGSERS